MELLFSYGTLQLEAVQLRTFGRRLIGRPDRLPGYRKELLEITDPAVVGASGKTHHPIVVHSGESADGVDGVVFEVTAEELARADAYAGHRLPPRPRHARVGPAGMGLSGRNG